MENLKKDLIQAAKEIYELGLVIGQVGNISTRDGNEILITAHGASLRHLKDEDIVTIDLSCEVVSGNKEPAAEKWMHAEIYKNRDDVKAIVHTHSPYASAFAYLKKELLPVNPEAEYILGKVPVIPHFVPGTKELAEATARYLTKAKVALLERHGVIVAGADLAEAINLSELIEEVAKINYLINNL